MKKLEMFILILLVIILSLSLIISANKISSSINKLNQCTMSYSIQQNENTAKNILTLEEAAQYLKITPESFKEILDHKQIGLLYVKVNEEYIFTTKNIDDWLEKITLNIP